MAVLSLNLGLINLMPVPVLDGGHIRSWPSKESPAVTSACR